ncbi:MAG: type IV pilus twitching motility protein PilT [Oscillospiraceae bacterium]|nr:type IV pilus twitching motility protein PilT [Oscillospiraceae bacterium]
MEEYNKAREGVAGSAGLSAAGSAGLSAAGSAGASAAGSAGASATASKGEKAAEVGVAASAPAAGVAAGAVDSASESALDDANSLEYLLEYATGKNATDLHIGVGIAPLIRVGSILEVIPGASVVMPQIANVHVKALVDDKRMEQLMTAGEIDFSFSRPGLGRFRANIYRQRNTYGIAIRSLPFNIPPFETLGLPSVIKNFTKKNKGLILATGATGSGKTTTLASLVNIVNSERSCHIITIEDPIEYLHRHNKSFVCQREIGSDTHSFSSALRAALREDPDVIMVGEMRDAETISIALTAAETGHLVFSSLHTIGAAKTIDRIIDVFPPNQQTQVKSQLATVLEGVVSQQMLPNKDNTGICVACEVMIVNNAIRNLIREGKPHQINSIIQTSTNIGMQTMESSLADLTLSGRITQDDAMLRATDAQLLISLLNRR